MVLHEFKLDGCAIGWDDQHVFECAKGWLPATQLQALVQDHARPRALCPTPVHPLNPPCRWIIEEHKASGNVVYETLALEHDGSSMVEDTAHLLRITQNITFIEELMSDFNVPGVGHRGVCIR